MKKNHFSKLYKILFGVLLLCSSCKSDGQTQSVEIFETSNSIIDNNITVYNITT